MKLAKMAAVIVWLSANRFANASRWEIRIVASDGFRVPAREFDRPPFGAFGVWRGADGIVAVARNNYVGAAYATGFDRGVAFGAFIEAPQRARMVASAPINAAFCAAASAGGIAFGDLLTLNGPMADGCARVAALAFQPAHGSAPAEGRDNVT